MKMLFRTLIVLTLASLLAGCAQSPAPSSSPAPAASPSSAPTETPIATPTPEAADYGVIGQEPEQPLPVGATVQVYWRERELTDPKPKEFQKHGTLQTVDGPGQVNGTLIVECVKDKIADKEGELRAVSVSAGDKPSESFSGISVDAGDNEFYDNYVCQDEAGTLLLFLEFSPPLEQ